MAGETGRRRKASLTFAALERSVLFLCVLGQNVDLKHVNIGTNDRTLVALDLFEAVIILVFLPCLHVDKRFLALDTMDTVMTFPALYRVRGFPLQS